MNHPPASFEETLDQVDPDGRIQLSSDAWFAPGEADILVFFVESEQDVITLPRIGQEVLARVSHRSGSLIRVKATIDGTTEVRVQINDLSKASSGAQFQGCIAALDLASLGYDEDSLLIERINFFCAGYD
ncbi:hypothetical protein AB3Y40_11295 [Yoonia sp. R2331]|uniref:hypothetical protein n=1 Tax=Yoonia sp. R2331 TaxID=3237238 RepID=UPI0034E5DF4A